MRPWAIAPELSPVRGADELVEVEPGFGATRAVGDLRVERRVLEAAAIVGDEVARAVTRPPRWAAGLRTEEARWTRPRRLIRRRGGAGTAMLLQHLSVGSQDAFDVFWTARSMAFKASRSALIHAPFSPSMRSSAV